jgi:geranyl-CoA carboxylase alpha subunit
MPGKVVELRVAEGDQVSAGQLLLVLEAMKMEHPVHASRAGRVAKVSAGVGEQVSDAQTLLVIGPAEGDRSLESAAGR